MGDRVKTVFLIINILMIENQINVLACQYTPRRSGHNMRKMEIVSSSSFDYLRSAFKHIFMAMWIKPSTLLCSRALVIGFATHQIMNRIHFIFSTDTVTLLICFFNLLLALALLYNSSFQFMLPQLRRWSSMGTKVNSSNFKFIL